MNRTFASFFPLRTFFIYVLACGAAIMVFHFFFPGETAPLSHFFISWRLIRGLLFFLDIFPALALSALILPFGFTVLPQETMTPFSPGFLRSLRMSIITAISAAAIYAMLFFLLLPLARDYEANLRFQGHLHQHAREQAQQHAARGEWTQAAQFLAICEQIWPGSYQVAALRNVTLGQLEDMQRFGEPLEAPPEPPPIGPQPLDLTQAVLQAEIALTEARFFDAHWLAAIAIRLASPNAPEMAAAARIASMAWEGVNSLAPTQQETEAVYIFRQKLEGFQALSAGDWIRAYYIFLELMERSPHDPDVHRFFAMSEEGLRQVAFFLDEMDVTLGTILTGAVFSFPFESGRLVMRFSSISMFPDSAYCMGAEIIAFDQQGHPLWSMEAPYARIMPLSGLSASGPALSVLLRALHRTDPYLRWEPVAYSLGQSAPETAQIALTVPWDDFVLLSNVRRGLPALSMAELRRAARNLSPYGYTPQVFQVELIRRFAGPPMLLLLGILAITLGWRYRAHKSPRFMAIFMFAAMPLIFYTALNLLRSLVNNAAIWAVVSLGFTTAAILFAAAITVLLILFLIMLASQRG